MLSPVENRVKISHDKPQNINMRDFRKLILEKALFSKKKRLSTTDIMTLLSEL